MNNTYKHWLSAATLALGLCCASLASAEDKKPATQPTAQTTQATVTHAQTQPVLAPCTLSAKPTDKDASEEHKESVTTSKSLPSTKPTDEKPTSPAPVAVWTPGTWFWTGHAYRWVPGRWRLPPVHGHSWMAAVWACLGQKCVHTPGRWVGPGPLKIQASVVVTPPPRHHPPTPKMVTATRH